MGRWLRVFAMMFIVVAISVNAKAQFSNGQAASEVIGQMSLDSTNTSASDSTLSTAASAEGGVFHDIQHAKLYIFDLNNNRVLRFAYPPGGYSVNQPKAEMAFGQTDLNSGGSGTTGETMNQAYGGVVLDDTLWVVDAANNRILGFYNASTRTTGASADVVLGQADFLHGSPGTSDSTMNYPTGVTIDPVSRDLYVAEAFNNRVLKFNANNKSTGAHANLVFGQSDFSGTAPVLADSGMSWPAKVLVYKNSLFVSTYSQGRVIRFDNLRSITSNRPKANVAFGQVDLSSFSSVQADSVTLLGPDGLAVDSLGRLYVSDYNWNRVLIFPNALTNKSHDSATAVLGKPDFASTGWGSGATGFKSPDEIAFDIASNKMFVVDAGNNRVLQFNAVSPLPVEIASFGAEVSGSAVRLHWMTATEVNNYGFNIDKKTASEGEWSTIGFQLGAGSRNTPGTYSFVDKDVKSGTYSYRLKNISRDGTASYSNAVAVTLTGVPSIFELDQNFPNPFNPSTQIGFSVGTTSHTSLKIFNLLGQTVATLFDGLANSGQRYTVTVDASHLASGVYFYRLQSGSSVATRKLSVLK